MPRPPKDKSLTPKDVYDWAKEVEEVSSYVEPIEIPDLPAEVITKSEPTRAAFRPVQKAPLPERLEPLETGAYRSIDKRTADKMRRGKLSVDAVLDLHGLREFEAAEHFYSFIRTQQQNGARCVLVITGQGLRSGKGPVLQLALQRWVNEPMLRPFIVALDYATAKQGGKGAYILYLRRTRHYE